MVCNHSYTATTHQEQRGISHNSKRVYPEISLQPKNMHISLMDTITGKFCRTHVHETLLVP